MLRALRRAADRRRQAHGDYAWLFYPYTGDELVAVACRSTGQDPRTAELLSLAAVRLRGDRVLTSDSLELHLRRPASLDAETLRLCGLRRVDLAGGERLEQGLSRLLDFVGNRPLIGWHLDHDLAILNRELRARFGFDLPNARIDVAQEYLRQRRRSHLELGRQPGFEQAAEGLGLPMMGQHTALGNAVTTALMHLRLSRGGVPVC